MTSLGQDSVFHGGPFATDRASEVHSLVVHMNGAGRSSVGAYVRVYDDAGNPTDAFEWDAELVYDPDRDAAFPSTEFPRGPFQGVVCPTGRPLYFGQPEAPGGPIVRSPVYRHGLLPTSGRARHSLAALEAM